ncbi:hypothetical protein D3C85_1434830 [compost metagenome]
MPPSIMAPKDSPDSRNPAATPGKMACDMASPIKLMRRSTRNTPSGAAPSDKAQAPASARRMKP